MSSKSHQHIFAALRRLQTSLAKISDKSRLERFAKLGARPKLIKVRDRVALRIYRERNHQRPHFHIEFKKQFAASYSLDTYERLAGSIPAKYEKEMLGWARQNQAFLVREWHQLNAGNELSWAQQRHSER